MQDATARDTLGSEAQGMSSGLDPARLTPAASLNRVRFVETADLAPPPDLLGRTAFELLSARALADLVRQHAAAFGPAPNRSGGSATSWSSRWPRPGGLPERLRTTLGVGFPPASGPGTPLSRGFAVIDSASD